MPAGWSLLRYVAMTTSTTKRGEAKQAVLSCWYRSFMAWHQNQPIHLVQNKRKKEETNKGKVFFMMWGGQL